MLEVTLSTVERSVYLTGMGQFSTFIELAYLKVSHISLFNIEPSHPINVCMGIVILANEL